MLAYWVVIKYMIDDNYDAESIGIYSTREKAVNKVLQLIKKEYESYKCPDDLIEASPRK